MDLLPVEHAVILNRKSDINRGEAYDNRLYSWYIDFDCGLFRVLDLEKELTAGVTNRQGISLPQGIWSHFWYVQGYVLVARWSALYFLQGLWD
jgi:hypothetical protein